MLESLLDEIPQLGESRRTALLDRFGSVSAIRKATLAELEATPGIGSIIAGVIHSHLERLKTPAVDMETGEILSP
jgi:excinuclease ABC subunit C